MLQRWLNSVRIHLRSLRLCRPWAVLAFHQPHLAACHAAAEASEERRDAVREYQVVGICWWIVVVELELTRILVKLHKAAKRPNYAEVHNPPPRRVHSN